MSFDESILKYRVHIYELQTGACLNTPDSNIKIKTDSKDMVVHPAESNHLLVEELLLKKDTKNIEGDLVSLVATVTL